MSQIVSLTTTGALSSLIYLSQFGHNYHQQNTDNPGNFEDFMEGRIRLLTAITPTYAHAHQVLCLTGRSAEKCDDLKELALFTDGGTDSTDGETGASWSVVARSPDGRTHTNNAAELSSIIESFLGPAGSATRSSQACIVHDSKHAANKCMGMIQTRANVQLVSSRTRTLTLVGSTLPFILLPCSVLVAAWTNILHVLSDVRRTHTPAPRVQSRKE